MKFFFSFLVFLNPFLFLWMGIVNINVTKVSFVDMRDSFYLFIGLLLIFVIFSVFLRLFKIEKKTIFKFFTYWNLFWFVRIALYKFYQPLDGISIFVGFLMVVLFHYLSKWLWNKSNFSLNNVYIIFTNIIVVVALIALTNRFYVKFKKNDGRYYDLSNNYKEIDQFLKNVKIKSKPNIYYIALEEMSDYSAYKAVPVYKSLLTDEDKDRIAKTYDDYSKRGFSMLNNVIGIGTSTIQATSYNFLGYPYYEIGNVSDLYEMQFHIYRFWGSEIFRLLTENGYNVYVNDASFLRVAYKKDQFNSHFLKKNHAFGETNYINSEERISKLNFEQNQVLWNFFMKLGLTQDQIDRSLFTILNENLEDVKLKLNKKKPFLSYEYYNHGTHNRYYKNGCSGEKLSRRDEKNISAKIRIDHECSHPKVMARIDEIRKKDPESIIIVTGDHISALFHGFYKELSKISTGDMYKNYANSKNVLYAYYLPKKYRNSNQLKNVRNSSDTFLAIFSILSNNSSFSSISDKLNRYDLMTYPYSGRKKELKIQFKD